MNACAFEEWPFIMTFTMETCITHKCITENTQTSMTHHDLKREVRMYAHPWLLHMVRRLDQFPWENDSTTTL